MPININYGPAGLAGLLAVQAGEGEARQRNTVLDLQIVGLAQSGQAEMNRQAAEAKRFQLQVAHADRVLAAQMKTPAAEYVQDRAGQARADREVSQKRYKTQLDRMLADQSIDPGQYQKGLLAVMTGNEGLMQNILATPKAVAEKPNISNAEEVDIIRRPFTERRHSLEQRLQTIDSNLTDFAAIPDMAAPLQKQRDLVQSQIDKLFSEESAAIDKWRTEGRKGTQGESPTGTGSVTTRRIPQNASEQNILDILSKQGISLPSFQPKTTQIGQTAPSAVETDAGSQTPPSSYPDAIWDAGRGMWVVIRNGRLMGVRQ